jgi:hypothetical protein
MPITSPTSEDFHRTAPEAAVGVRYCCAGDRAKVERVAQRRTASWRAMVPRSFLKKEKKCVIARSFEWMVRRFSTSAGDDDVWTSPSIACLSSRNGEDRREFKIQVDILRRSAFVLYNSYGYGYISTY